MTQQVTQVDWTKVRDAAGPYPLEAFTFVREGLSYTVQCVHANVGALQEADRHINGQQLCLGLRDFAIERYGLLAPVVLDHWHIKRTDDFGRIVFAMVDHGIMSKTDNDRLDNFRAVYDFQEAFSHDEMVSRIGCG